jgi:hypothetical protein
MAAVIVYGGFVALLYVCSNIFPSARYAVPSAVGLTKAEEVALDTTDVLDSYLEDH